jgi:hypothetical protein
MITWRSYKGVSSEFLSTHRDLVLYDAFHHITAFLLFPPNCSCGDSCHCSEWRSKVVFSLNTSHYNKSCLKKKDGDLLATMKSLWSLPEDHLFREKHDDAYPPWLIEKELKEREDGNAFKRVDRLVWAILRLAETHKATIFRTARASKREVIKLILGTKPLKVKGQEKDDYLGGEKAHFDSFNEYEAVCHLIAASEYVKKKYETPSLNTPDHIEEFLKTAHWLRKRLLGIKTPNTKMKIMFSEEALLPLPLWVESDNLDIPLEPFQERLEEIENDVREELRKQGHDYTPTYQR